MRKIRLPAYRKIESPPLALVLEPLVQHEVGGGWTVGWGDDAPNFPTKRFAEAVAGAKGARVTEFNAAASRAIQPQA
jgi:hypothetical protein